MQAHNNTIEEFLGAPKTVFVVPVYQRNYDWQDNNCKQLFNDILRVVETGQEHFLGTICFKVDSSHERSLIDGQQRLTSITLMLKAIYNYDSNEDNRSEIHDQYIFNKGRGIDNEFLKYKLHLNKRDDIIYHIILNEDPSKYDARLTPSQKSSRLYQNYLLFTKLIKDYVTNKKGSIDHILEALRKLTIIELEITKENPQEIFESLNSTGKDLTKVDLLRNYFLMQFNHEEQTKLYDNYWSQIEDAIGVDRMEQFFVDFLIFRKRSDSLMINGKSCHITEGNLYIAFKNYHAALDYETPYEKTSHCFADLKACAEVYKQFVFSDEIDLDKETKIRKKLYFLLSVNDSNKARSLLLYIFDLHKNRKIDDKMLDTAVDGIASLTFRARICKAQGINRQFSGNVMQRLDAISDYSRFIDTFWQAITAGKGSFAFPSDAEFRNALMYKDLYQTLRSRGTKYLLYTLEAFSPFPKGLPPFLDDTISIEHIMPQKLNAQWKTYLNKDTLQQCNLLLHRLGNLALTNYNGEMSNKAFNDKKPIYKESKFYYTRTIVESNEWQIDSIEKRSEKLASAALKIWSLPEKYQKSNTEFKTQHTLSEDTAQFSHTKPASLSLGDEEFSVNSWSDILPIICKVLDKDNHEIFVNIATSEKLKALRIANETNQYANNNSYAHVVDNIYVRVNKSAVDILDTAGKIFKQYDNIAETDFYSSFLFSLK